MTRMTYPTGRCIAITAFTVCIIASCTESSGPSAQFTVLPDTSTVAVGGTRQFTAMGAPGTVQWSSGNTAVASVVPQTGFATGIAPGVTEITAASGGSSASATLTVLALPLLHVSEPAIEFDRVTTGPAAGSRSIIVSNAGTGVIDNVAVGAPVYGAGEPGGWLSAASNGTTAPVTVTFTVDSTRAQGTYTATVPVSANGIVNSPQHVAVTYHVRLPGPSISLNPTSVQFAGIGGGTTLPAAQTVQVTNSGGGALSGLAHSIAYTSGSGWLTGSLNTTTAPATLELRPNTTALAAGTYTAQVTVTSTVAGVAPRTVNVTYVVQTFSVSVFPFFTSATCSGCHVTLPPAIPAGTTAAQYYANLGPFVIAGNAANSRLVCKIFAPAVAPCTHVGGKFNGTAGFQAIVEAWINAGAPFP